MTDIEKCIRNPQWSKKKKKPFWNKMAENYKNLVEMLFLKELESKNSVNI